MSEPVLIKECCEHVFPDHVHECRWIDAPSCCCVIVDDEHWTCDLPTHLYRPHAMYQVLEVEESMTAKKIPVDAEAIAIGRVVDALSELPNDEARTRVLKYAHERIDAKYRMSERHVWMMVEAINTAKYPPKPDGVETPMTDRVLAERRPPLVLPTMTADEEKVWEAANRPQKENAPLGTLGPTVDAVGDVPDIIPAQSQRETRSERV